MNAGFDPQEVNHLTVAIEREMSPCRGGRHLDADMCFIGGVETSAGDLDALARFGLAKNYQLIQPVYREGGTSAPNEFNCIVTDGLTTAFALAGGRLWKRDRRTAAVLLFPNAETVVKLSSKGRLILRQMTGPYHDHGYDLAHDAVVAGAARRPGLAPIVTTVGTMIVVLDARTLKAALEAAE